MKDKNMKKNVIWNTIGVFTLSLTSFVYSLILVRLCDLSITGVWSYCFAIACTSVVLASFGGRTYQVTDAKNTLPTFTYISSRYTTVAFTLILIICFVFIKGFDFNRGLIIILLCLFKFCEELSDVYYGVLQKHDKLYIVGKSMFFKSILNMILFLIGVYLTRNLLLPVILILLNNFLFIYLYDRRNALKLEKIKKVFNKEFYKKYFKDNLMICIFLFLATYLVNCPKYVMENYLSDEMQGIYNILVLPATAVSLIGSFIINPLLVNFSKDYADGRNNLIRKKSNKIVLILLLFGLVASIGGYLLGTPVLKIIYDFDLKNYMFGFILIIIGCTFYTISTVLSMVLITTRKLIPQLVFNVLLSIFAYVLCTVLIKNQDINGAIYSYLIIMLIRFIVYVIMVNLLKESKNEEEKSVARIS